MSPLPGLVLALLPLMAWPAEAQPPTERTLRARRVPLTGAPIAVRVAPGIPTTLNFDADLDPRTVELDDPERVTVLAIAARALTLMPVAELGAAVELRVRFADAALPLEPAFSLRADAAEVDTQVTAYRDARAPALLARLAQLEARSVACEAELASQSERGLATSPAFLVLSGQLEGGVQEVRLPCKMASRADGWKCTNVTHHRTERWMVVSSRLQSTPGHPVWKPGRAWLVNESSGERLTARVVAMAPEALVPDAAAIVAVEFALPTEPPGDGDVFQLEVQEAEGTRHLYLSVAGSDLKWNDALQPPAKKEGP